MRDTVIRNAIVLTMNEAQDEYVRADLFMKDGKIAGIGPDLGPVDAHEIDGEGYIVMPGFVDTHRHTWQCLLRNAAADWTLSQYFAGVRGVMGELYTPDDMYVSNYIGSLEALNAGITTMVDWSHNNNSPDHADMAVKGLRDSGVRGVFGYGNANREWFPVSDERTDFDDVARVKREHFSSDDDLVTMAFAARGPQFATMEQTERDFKMARDMDLPLTLHAGDGLWGLNHPVKQLQEKNLLGPRTTYVHCCTLDQEEFQMIGDTGGTVSISAEVELNMGHGNPAAMGCLNAGFRPSISIDVCTSVGSDMFTQMRILMAATRGIENAKALAEHKVLEPMPLSVRDVLDFATLQGARTANLDHVTGSLEVGKDADVIMIDTNDINMFPINNPAGAVLEDAHVGNIDTVFVRGRIVKRHGKLVDVDIRSLRKQMDGAVDSLFERAGVPRDGTWLPDQYVRGTDAEN